MRVIGADKLSAVRDRFDGRGARLSRPQIGFLLFLPSLLLIGLLIVYPLLYNIWLSITNKELLSTSYSVVGVQNFAQLFGDPRFINAFFNNVTYAVGTTVGSVVVGLAISLILNNRFRGQGIATTLVIYPYLVPTVVTALAFEWLFHPLHGIVNQLLLSAGLIGSPISFFSSDLAMASVIMVSVWRFVPFVVIMCLARLQTIPEELYEAARIEGANTWHQFRYVTLPQLRIILFIAILLRFVWIFNMFDIIWLLTGGGPVDKTEHLPILIYQTMFNTYQVGKAASIGIVMLAMLVVFAVALFRVYDVEFQEGTA